MLSRRDQNVRMNPAVTIRTFTVDHTEDVLALNNAHIPELNELDAATFDDTQALLKETIKAIRDVYRPDGLNVGMNVGAAAGAGIAAHCHWHVLPRWKGDVNFLPVFADVKVLNEGLDDTWARLAARIRRPHEG